MEEVQSEPIESKEASAIEHVAVIAEICRGEDVELLPPHGAVLSVCGDWRAGTQMRARRGAQAVFFVFGYLTLAGRALDYSRLDSGIADTFADLTGIDFRDFIDAALFEVCGVAQVFLVETGRAHDAHARGLGNLGHKIDVAADIHGTRIDKA